MNWPIGLHNLFQQIFISIITVVYTCTPLHVVIDYKLYIIQHLKNRDNRVGTCIVKQTNSTSQN